MAIKTKAIKENLQANQPQSTKKPEPLIPDGRIRLQPLAKRVGVSSVTIRRWIKANLFPKPVYVNGIPMFNNAEVLEWFAETNKKGGSYE